MAFMVPAEYCRFSINVEKKFKKLLDHKVLTTITSHGFAAWWHNFHDDHERYLGAHLLDALVLRTDAMMASTSRHILEMVLMRAMRRCGIVIANDFDEFVKLLRTTPQNRQPLAPLRIVPVSLPGRVAKSGDTVLRLFKRATGISDRYLIPPEAIKTLSNSVKCFIFLDDCLGTGKQFCDFIEAYSIQTVAANTACIYIPSLAHPAGLAKVAQVWPDIHVWPAEVLTDHCGFFCGQPTNASVWRRDGTNTVDDVRKFYTELLESRGIVPAMSGRFGLDMTLGFHDATPNNTLKAMFANQSGWSPLLQR